MRGKTSKNVFSTITKLKQVNMSASSIAKLTIGILFPIAAIGLAAWYFGFLYGEKNFKDPCNKLPSEDKCENLDGCKWSPKYKGCRMDSTCTDVTAQQDCGAGCHWDATIKRYNSNLYGLCRPASFASKADAGEGGELK